MTLHINRNSAFQCDLLR